MQLHVPLEAGTALITGKHAGGKVASFDVCHQRRLAGQARITDVTEEFARNFRLVGDSAGQVGQHSALIGRSSGTGCQLPIQTNATALDQTVTQTCQQNTGGHASPSGNLTWRPRTSACDPVLDSVN